LELSKQFELSVSCTKGMAQAAAAIREVQTLRGMLGVRRAWPPAVQTKISTLDAEAAKLNFTASNRLLGTALGVAQSADRTPPAVAYTIYTEASRDLSAQLAAWKSLREVKLAELNRELQQNKLPVIDLK
jgi:hypothetical protein